MVLGWVLVVVTIYGLFFYSPADQGERTYLSSRSLQRRYMQENGRSPGLEGQHIGPAVVFQCLGAVAGPPRRP